MLRVVADTTRLTPVRYRAPPPSAVKTVALDAFTALHHRPSGTTHLLTEPAPQILALLGAASATLDELLARLNAEYELVDADRDALIARLDELIAAGLVERV